MRFALSFAILALLEPFLPPSFPAPSEDSLSSASESVCLCADQEPVAAGEVASCPCGCGGTPRPYCAHKACVCARTSAVDIRAVQRMTKKCKCGCGGTPRPSCSHKGCQCSKTEAIDTKWANEQMAGCQCGCGGTPRPSCAHKGCVCSKTDYGLVFVLDTPREDTPLPPPRPEPPGEDRGVEPPRPQPPGETRGVPPPPPPPEEVVPPPPQPPQTGCNLRGSRRFLSSVGRDRARHAGFVLFPESVTFEFEGTDTTSFNVRSDTRQVASGEGTLDPGRCRFVATLRGEAAGRPGVRSRLTLERDPIPERGKESRWEGQLEMGLEGTLPQEPIVYNLRE